MKFTRYANITDEQKNGIVAKFREVRELYPTDQAVSITANDFWKLTNRQWNSKAGADVFAATLAVLVMKRQLNLVDVAE